MKLICHFSNRQMGLITKPLTPSITLSFRLFFVHNSLAFTTASRGLQDSILYHSHKDKGRHSYIIIMQCYTARQVRSINKQFIHKKRKKYADLTYQLLLNQKKSSDQIVQCIADIYYTNTLRLRGFYEISNNAAC